MTRVSGFAYPNSLPISEHRQVEHQLILKQLVWLYLETSIASQTIECDIKSSITLVEERKCGNRHGSGYQQLSNDLPSVIGVVNRDEQ